MPTHSCGCPLAWGAALLGGGASEEPLSDTCLPGSGTCPGQELVGRTHVLFPHPLETAAACLGVGTKVSTWRQNMLTVRTLSDSAS